MSMKTESYEGRCFCGDVEIRVTGEPVAMGFCHCESCRSWSAGPVNYQEHVLRITDDLPRLKDFPAELGGSGEAWAE